MFSVRESQCTKQQKRPLTTKHPTVLKCFKVKLFAVHSFRFHKLSVLVWLDISFLGAVGGIKRHFRYSVSSSFQRQILLSVQLLDCNQVSCPWGCFQSVVLILSMLRGQFETWSVADGELLYRSREGLEECREGSQALGAFLKFAKKQADVSVSSVVEKSGGFKLAFWLLSPRQRVRPLRLHNHTISGSLQQTADSNIQIPRAADPQAADALTLCEFISLNYLTDFMKRSIQEIII